MNVIRYETKENNITFAMPTIFLAGPTVRGNQQHLVSWRFEAIDIFKKMGFDGNLIIPEFSNNYESDKHRPDLPVWENHGLNGAHVIMFWIPRTRELIGLTTNFELGYWMGKKRDKVIYGRPDDAYRIDYLDIMWKLDAGEKNIPIHNTLEKTTRASINLAYEKHNDNFPKIYGFNKTSEAGQDVFASSIFLGGCNWRCPYCMNSKLVWANEKLNGKEISLMEIKKQVLSEKAKWVFISGGEPTFQDRYKLKNLIKQIKSWGCKVGMSTNGSHWDVLINIINYLDFVTMDIKTGSYETDLGQLSHHVFISKKMLEKHKSDNENFNYEIRTTLYPEFFQKLSEIDKIASKFNIQKNERWVFQQFRVAKNMLCADAEKWKPFDDKKLEEIMSVARKYSNHVSLKFV